MIVAGQILLIFMLSTLPTPLYHEYGQRFGFSVLTLTLIFAAYTIGTLSTLVFFGRLSDQVGRRKVSLAGIGLAALAALVFMLARSTIWLFAARIVSGLAVGLAAGTAIAWMQDLHGPDEKLAAKRSVAVNILALGLGPLFTGLLAGLAPWPFVLTYAVYIGLLVPLAAGVFLAKETVREAPELNLDAKTQVPSELRRQFLAPALTAFVTFSLVGYYSAISPGSLIQTLHIHSLVFAGVVVSELFVVGSVTVYALSGLASRTAMLAGAAAMLPALVLLVLALELKSVLALAVGTAFGGIALGLGYRGALEILDHIAPASQRASLVSSLFVVGNLSLAIPVIGVGVVSQLASPKVANLIFAVVIAAFAVAGLVLGMKLEVPEA